MGLVSTPLLHNGVEVVYVSNLRSTCKPNNTISRRLISQMGALCLLILLPPITVKGVASLYVIFKQR